MVAEIGNKIPCPEGTDVTDDFHFDLICCCDQEVDTTFNLS